MHCAVYIVAFLVVFSVLGLFMIWSYEKVCVSPTGPTLRVLLANSLGTLLGQGLQQRQYLLLPAVLGVAVHDIIPPLWLRTYSRRTHSSRRWFSRRQVMRETYAPLSYTTTDAL